MHTAAIEQGRMWGTHAADWAAQEEMEPERFEPAAVLVRPGDTVLEVGCGSGVFLRMAADRGARVFGVDAAPALVELARRRVPEAGVRTGDAEALPFADDSFDLVAGSQRLLLRRRPRRGAARGRPRGADRRPGGRRCLGGPRRARCSP